LLQPGSRARTLTVLALAAACGVGLALRLCNLAGQVMAGDELHAVRAAVTRPVSDLLFAYQEADNCIPLSTFDRLLIDAGVPLTEMLVRLPVLLAGLAMLALGPWWARRRLGAGSAIALAWLLAISPALVFYSRIARSYMPIALFGCAAVVAFEAWLRRGGWRLALAYVAAATVAVWFHLGAAPLVVAPLFAALPGIVRRRGRGALRLLGVIAALAAALLALLVPARATLLPLIASKSGALQLTTAEVVELAAWLAGVRWAWVALPFWAVVGYGALRLARRDARLAGVLGTAAVGQVAGILALAPVGHQSAVILARYLVPALPLALVFAAEVLGDIGESRPRRAGEGPAPTPEPVPDVGFASAAWAGPAPAPPGVRPSVLAILPATTVVVALFMAGPFTDRAIARSSFAHSGLLLRFTASRPTLPPPGLPPVYAWIGRTGPGTMVELPWHPVWRFDRSLALYQLEHGRPVLVTTFGPPLADRRLAFRNMVRGDVDGLLASRGRWLVVHRSLIAEGSRIGAVAADGRIRYELRMHALDAVRRLREAWGAPDYRDDDTWCWDLDRVRRGAPGAPRTR